MTTMVAAPKRRSALPELLGVLAAVLAIKGYTLVVLYVAAEQVEIPRDYRPFLFLSERETRSERLAEVEGSFLERLAPYDGQYYLDIAARGYRRWDRKDPNAGSGPRGNYAFFPLYPALIRLANQVGEEAAMAFLVAANVLLSSAAAVGVYLLARRLALPAWPSVLLLATFPTAVFQSVLYTESLFLFLSVGVALSALSTERACSWSGVGLGYLAGLTRPQGVLVSALWLPRILRPGGGEAERGRRLLPIAAAAAPLVGIATFCVILAVSVDAPLGFLGIQKYWAREFSLSRLLAEVAAPGSYKGPPFDLLALLFGVGLVPLLWRHLPPALALFGTLSVLLPLSTGTALSFGRFISLSFPHFLALAALLDRWRVALLVLLAGFIVLQSLVAKGVMGWHFLG